MTTKLRMCIASIVLVTVIGLVSLSNASTASDQGDEKDLKVVVVKIADALKKNDKETAKKLAAAAVKNKDLVEEMSDIMHMFRPRNKGGMGIGNTPLANPAKDSIDVTLRELGRDVPSNIGKQAEALETTGYWVAAISELAKAKGWGKDSGMKTKKAWNDYSDEMSKLGVEFSKAAAGKGGQQIKSAAKALHDNCNRCHSIFKE